MDRLEADVAAGSFPSVHLKTLVERACSQAKTELAGLAQSAAHESDETKCCPSLTLQLLYSVGRASSSS